MNPTDKKTPYIQAGKRNPMQDVATDAGRRAKHRTQDKSAEAHLRTILKNPTDSAGRPVAGHLLKVIAAERLVTAGNAGLTNSFDYAAGLFLSALTYNVGCVLTVSNLWMTFLEIVDIADTDIAREFARDYVVAFRWCVRGHVHRLNAEYETKPDALLSYEIWQGKKEIFTVGVQRNGERTLAPPTRPPSCPMMVNAGDHIYPFVAPKDIERMQKMDQKQLLSELDSGKFIFSPRPKVLITEEAILNVVAPTDAALDQIRPQIALLLTASRYIPRKRRTKP